MISSTQCGYKTYCDSMRSGGVRGYWVRVGSGYVMAINHFLQRIDQTNRFLGEIEALTESLRTNKPKF